MDYVELINKYKEQMTPGQMMAVAETIGKFVASKMSEDEMHRLCTLIYGVIGEGHFDRAFAEEAIKKMWYEDEEGRHMAPFFDEDEVEETFEKYKDAELSDYTIYDWAVTLNMLRSDNNRFLMKYAKDEEMVKEMVVDMALDYLQDPDAEYPMSKIWHYING